MNLKNKLKKKSNQDFFKFLVTLQVGRLDGLRVPMTTSKTL